MSYADLAAAAAAFRCSTILARSPGRRRRWPGMVSAHQVTPLLPAAAGRARARRDARFPLCGSGFLIYPVALILDVRAAHDWKPATTRSWPPSFAQEAQRAWLQPLCASPRLTATGRSDATLRLSSTAGYHGTMDWMDETLERRAEPDSLWPRMPQRSSCSAMNYGPEEDPLGCSSAAGRGAISVYARNRDYHDIIKGRLKEIGGKIRRALRRRRQGLRRYRAGDGKAAGERAGLGWQGKHTNLVSRELGSWLFLGSIFTTADLPHGRAGERPLRLLPGLSGRLPDRCLSRTLQDRCAALHFLSDHRAQGR